MCKDELKSLQYVGGYVPHSLLKKYKKELDQSMISFQLLV